jgi:hypothetical protein
MLTDEVLKSYSWLSATFAQYHLLTYALWHLCVCPATPGIERAWRAVYTAFELTENDSTSRGFDHHWAVLCRLRQKASSIWRLYLGANQRQVQTDLYFVTLTGLPDIGQDAELEESWMSWDIDPLAFFDWAALAQTL